MPQGSHDIAQICLNGHLINSSHESFSQFSQKYCDECEEETITQCPKCSASIKGFYHGSIVANYDPPSNCCDCGKPYPWTERRLKALVELN